MSPNYETTAAAPPPTGPPPAASRPLFRSRGDRKVAGVCAGVSAYLGIDPIIVRILVVVLSLFGGSGLLLYAAGWLLIPDQGEPRSELQKLLGRDGPSRPLTVLVTIVVVVALIVGAGSIFAGPHWLGSGPDIWPLLAIGGIAFAVWYSRRHPTGFPPAGSQSTPPTTVGWVPPTNQSAPPAAASAGQGGAGWSSAPDPADPYAGYSGSSAYPGYVGYSGSQPTAQQPEPVVPKTRRPRSALGVLTLSTTAIAAGVMIALHRTGTWHMQAAGFLGVLLLIVGAGLIVGAFVGRSRGLIAWGILLSLATATAAAVPAIDGHGTGDVTWHPTSLSALPADGYRWGAGDTQLDLTALPPATTHIQASLGAGTMIVMVPAGTVVILDAKVGLGTVRLPDGSHLDGVGRRVVRTLEPPGVPAAGTMHLTVQLGAGTLEVRRAQT